MLNTNEIDMCVELCRVRTPILVLLLHASPITFLSNAIKNYLYLICPLFFFLVGSVGSDVFKKQTPRMEATHVMEVAQLLLSLIHSWGLDPHLDKVCETQLGLLRPMVRESNLFAIAIICR